MTAFRSSRRERRITRTLPPHIAGWQLPPDWQWGGEGLVGDFRHYQEIIDGLGRSLSLVTAPDPAHHRWLRSEALQLGHRNHPSIPTTYHYWTTQRDRGPGYLRRWVSGETVAARYERLGPADVPYVLQVLRGACSTLAYLHDTAGIFHGALTADSIWVSATGRLWMLEWQWAIPRDERLAGLSPSLDGEPVPPEWRDSGWQPSMASDQWQLAAMCFTILTGEAPPADDVPPVKWLRPETPDSVAVAIDRALLADPDERFPSVATMLRTADRGYTSRTAFITTDTPVEVTSKEDPEELRVRSAVGDDYEILARLGGGTFGTVWRARDLSLEREVALKVLHQHIAHDGDAVSAFWREARLAAQLAHPAIVPIYDWDGRAELLWYTMELADGGSIANLVAHAGPRSLPDVAQQVDLLLDGLAAAHAIGVVHRDLKPENILIDRYHRWRLTDFGIANVTGEDSTEALGTLGFAAPEQLLGEPQGPSVDCFALAAIVFFALLGKQPFSGGDPKAILAQQLTGRLDVSSLPSAIGEWITTGLAASPAHRFPDVHTMQRSWRAALATTRKRDRVRRRWGWLLSGWKT
ncbi:MAG TPA: serine/threonine-protein kinase, partial [Gemmatimonadaceae bacterium]|jgi:serine/threonine protein kinase|nr:serine/threonine-protein kinase [Gemmatimonadaceae bacterium]